MTILIKNGHVLDPLTGGTACATCWLKGTG